MHNEVSHNVADLSQWTNVFFSGLWQHWLSQNAFTFPLLLLMQFVLFLCLRQSRWIGVVAQHLIIVWSVASLGRPGSDWLGQGCWILFWLSFDPDRSTRKRWSTNRSCHLGCASSVWPSECTFISSYSTKQMYLQLNCIQESCQIHMAYTCWCNAPWHSIAAVPRE